MTQTKFTPSTKKDHTRFLKNMGLKVTPPRLRILELFENSPTRHLSAEDVHRILQAEKADISFATIYRVLTQFEQAGVLIRHHFENNKAVFERNNTQRHDHLVCIHCGRVVEFFDPLIKKRQEEIAQKNGFRICAQSFYFYAHCLDCASPDTHRSPNQATPIVNEGNLPENHPPSEDCQCG